MSYAIVNEIKAEFKSLSIDVKDASLDTGKVQRFLDETDALINSFLSTRYSIPIAGTPAVAKVLSVQVTTVADNTTYTVTLNGKAFSILSASSGATATSIRDQLIAAINAGLEPLSAIIGSSDTLLVVADQRGVDFLSSVTANLTETITTANEIGSEGLRLLRKLEIDIVSCRIVKIIQVKAPAIIKDSGVRQDIKECSAEREAIKLLKSLQNGDMGLVGADLITSSGGLSSHADNINYEPTFKRDVKQW